jgi:serine/threonine protein kinase/Tol biopolymer transport system component
MEKARWQQIDKLLQSVLELEPGERPAFLRQACGGDDELRREVESLLASGAADKGFLDSPAYEVAATLLAGGEEESLVGRRLGSYQVLSRLGAGGMGEVFLAEDLRLGRKVALKLPDADRVGDRRSRERFLREARLASTLDHSNICTIHEVGEDSGRPYIAMQYIEGKTLSQLLDSRPLDLKSMLSISLQVADALEAAHERGIVHRDIKPSNIMVTARGQAKVLDFGLAKRMDDAGGGRQTFPNLTRTGAVMGTPAYMSPEQARGDRADHRSDIFSLGVVMYEMATGRQPFTRPSYAETMNAVINERQAPAAELNKEAPPGLSAVIDRALAKDPDGRYNSSSELIMALQAAPGAHLVTSSLPDGVITPYARVRERPLLGRFKRLARNPALLAALSLLALAAALLWWAPWRRPAPQPRQHRISTFPGYHQSASFSPEGRMIAFLNEVDGVSQVWVKNLAQGDPIQITFGEPPVYRPRWSPDNDQIVFGRGTKAYLQDIWSVPPLGGTPRLLIEGGRNPNWSWDGGRLVYEKGDDVWTARADGSEQRKLEGVPPVDILLAHRMPAFSRDGSQIAFFQPRKGPAGDIWVIPAAGGQARQVTFDDAVSSAPVWLADDRYIVYSSQRAGSTTLWKVPASGGRPEPVLISPGEDTDPEVSRDGTKLIYTNAHHSYAITLLNPATKQSRELWEGRTMYCDPSFSPQGDKIAFFALSDEGDSHIFTLGVDGRNLTQVTRDKGGPNAFPCWSPDGSSLYFSQHRPVPSLQKISLGGGPSSESVRGWTWDVYNGVQVDPTGRLAVCTKMENGVAVATIIREMESGQEREFPFPMRYPRWSRDGKWILGTSQSSGRFRGWVGEVSICSVETGECRQLTTQAKCPRWSADGSRVFFLRGGKAPNEEELWSISATGKDEKQVGVLQMRSDISAYYDVSREGEIVYVRFNPGRRELWLLDFPSP